jgi:hypothetical protein
MRPRLGQRYGLDGRMKHRHVIQSNRRPVVVKMSSWWIVLYKQRIVFYSDSWQSCIGYILTRRWDSGQLPGDI